MPRTEADNICDADDCQITTTEPKALAGLQQQYASAEEAIGALSRELITSRGDLTAKDIRLMLIVRLELSSGLAQQNILKEALMLITNKSLLDS